MRTAHENAAEFGRHVAGDGWPLAQLVACSVKRGTGHGVIPGAPEGKVTIEAFANEAGKHAVTGNKRIGVDLVREYLKAWERAAAVGMVADPDTLTPNDADDREHLPINEPFGKYYTPVTGGRPRDNTPEAAVAIVRKHGAAAVVNNMPPEMARAIYDAAERRIDNEAQPEFIDTRERDEAIVHNVKTNMNKALRVDEVARLIDAATSDLEEALVWKHLHGITDEARVAESLRDLHRALNLLEHEPAHITDADRMFLETLGIEG